MPRRYFMKEKFIQFMQGRYGGADKLNSHLMYLLFILVIKENGIYTHFFSYC